MAAKDLYEKDLYSILGVKKSDDATAVKKQYRKLARELHPDKTKGDKKLEDRFKEVSEAYEVLSDDKKRAEYDEMRTAFTSGRIPRGGPQNAGPGGFQGGDFADMFGSGNPQDIFSTLFGGGRAPRKGGDISTQTSISFRDSVFGTELNLKLAPQGSAPSTITTRVPAGINDGAKIKLKGRGSPGQAGPGDLYVQINVIPHPIFSRKGENLHMVLPVTFTEAALGADIAVPTLDGDEVTVRLAPGTPNGRTLRVKGRGIKKGHATGDLMISVEVQVPQRLEAKAKKALEDFADATSEYNPREELAQRAQA
ncbi:MAG: DnaJ C-terminal domain-containing protein [Actinomycetes bacterium]